MTLRLFGSCVTMQYARPLFGRTPFGLFHNFDASYEEVGYLTLHLFSARIGIYWTRA